MKRLFILFFAIALPITSLASELKIGFVNFDRIFRDSQLALKAQKKLEKEFQTRDQDIQKMSKQGRELQAYLEKEGLTLSEAERIKKQRELADLSRDLQRVNREYREDLNQRRNEETAGVLERARRAIIDIAEKEKYDLIVENVVFASTRVDITDRILRALDR